VERRFEDAKRLVISANASASNFDPCSIPGPGQVSLLDEALIILKAVAQPLDLRLFEVHTLLFEAYRRAREWASCLRHCQACLAVNEEVYAHMPCHPAISLRVFTLGNLFVELGRAEEANACFRRAHELLVLTHGTGSQFVKQLNILLDQ
jgi:hypothetical protein